MKTAIEHPSASVRRYAGDYPAHAHDHAQVLVGVDGCLELELEGRPVFVDVTCGLIVPAGVSHRFMAAAGATTFVIDAPMRVGLDRIRRFVPPARWRTLPGAIDAGIVLEAMIRAPAALARRRLDRTVLEQALAGRLHEHWTTERMAALYNLSPQRFHARWLDLMGVAPQAWLRAKRLDEAARWLQAGRTLEAAAARIGYHSASALAFALRRERGLGARTLRRQPAAVREPLDS